MCTDCNPVGPQVSSASVTPGGKITVTDTGWQPGSIVDLTLHSDPVDLGGANVGDDGAFAKLVTIPSDTAVGTHTIEISGTDANGDSATHAVKLTVSSTTATTSSSGKNGSSSSGTLPFTGGPARPLVGVGLAMIVAGIGLGARRRRDI